MRYTPESGNVQISLPVVNKNCDCLHGSPCTNHPSWSARVCSNALDARDKRGSEPCMQRFAVDEPWYKRKPLANTKRDSVIQVSLSVNGPETVRVIRTIKRPLGRPTSPVAYSCYAL